MGKNVHVIKRVQQYGCEGFSWKKDEFRDLLDSLGCETNGEYGEDEFECEVSLYEEAMDLLFDYTEFGGSDSVIEKFNEKGLDYNDFIKALSSLGSLAIDAKYVWGQMRKFYDDRDKEWDFICFSCW